MVEQVDNEIEQLDNDLGKRIDAEYLRIYDNPDANADELYNMLSVYLRPIVRTHLGMFSGRKQDVEDVLQNVLIVIFSKGCRTFDPEKGRFCTYCGRIAKNRTLTYQEKVSTRSSYEISLDNADDAVASDIFSDTYHSNPEKMYISEEMRQEFKDLTDRALNIFVRLDAKPYKLVGTGYSMVLSKKYPTANNKNDLTSPTWALSKLGDATVKAGADNFITEMNDWAKFSQLSWGKSFDENMKKEEFGEPISSLVFGDHFDRKSFENWDNSIRNKIKKELHKQEEAIEKLKERG
ncbi:MAG: hypothetical protein K5675_04625 [Lachnospiraceae bacterium]|nr:hypothetical protein [Lachnospiraceae bacterium]